MGNSTFCGIDPEILYIVEYPVGIIEPDIYIVLIISHKYRKKIKKISGINIDENDENNKK
jgi:hypothetical protein